MNLIESNEQDEFTVEDALAAFHALSERERSRLVRIARIFAGYGNLSSPEELVSEAYIRIAEGARHWRKGQAFTSFVAGVIRSLASDRQFLTDARKVRALDGGYSVVAQDELPNVIDPSDGTNLDRKAVVEDVFHRLEMHFAGDDEMQMLLIGIQDNLIGRDLQDAIGVDATRLESLRTRLNREIKNIGRVYRAMEGQSS